MFKFSNKKNRKRKKDERGSALILTMIVLVNALLIVSAITAISVQQKKQTSKVKNSAPAFQLADSGIEYALKMKIGNEAQAINTICGNFDSGNKVDCTNNLGLSSGEGEVYLYFLDASDPAKLIISDTVLISTVKYIRSVGVYGQGSEKVTRSLQVTVMEESP